MENLHNYLHKDLVNIVEEYTKDRTNYNIVLKHLSKMMRKSSGYVWMDQRRGVVPIVKTIENQNWARKRGYSHFRFDRKMNRLRSTEV